MLLPLTAVLIWSLNIVVTRYVTDFISPVSISFYRWFCLSDSDPVYSAASDS